MHVAAFIGELQHYKNFKPLYLSTGKWAISPFLSDQVTIFKYTCSFTNQLLLTFCVQAMSLVSLFS